MTFWKALKRLRKGKIKAVKSKSLNMYQQELGDLAYWLCECKDYKPMQRKLLFLKMLDATDWEEDEV